eukprot:9472161-Pyramimonas_sp.AAC.1
MPPSETCEAMVPSVPWGRGIFLGRKGGRVFFRAISLQFVFLNQGCAACPPAPQPTPPSQRPVGLHVGARWCQVVA